MDLLIFYMGENAKWVEWRMQEVSEGTWFQFAMDHLLQCRLRGKVFLRHNIIASKHGNMPIQVKATKVPGYKLPLTLIHSSIAPKKSAKGELRAHSPFHFLSA